MVEATSFALTYGSICYNRQVIIAFTEHYKNLSSYEMVPIKFSHLEKYINELDGSTYLPSLTSQCGDVKKLRVVLRPLLIVIKSDPRLYIHSWNEIFSDEIIMIM